MRLGNGLWESVKFNNQFQTTELTLGTSASNGNRLKLEYDYGTSDNNGNVKSQTITVPAMMMPIVGLVQGFTATQTYSYDELNRLKSAIETGNQTNWQQHFRYDRYGNRTVITEQNRIGQEAFTTSSIVGPNPDINQATNRIVPKQNSSEQYLFDASGNMTRDAVGNLYNYDAENHQTKYFLASNTNEPNATYFYDGDGRRVKKIVKVQSGQQTVDETTLFVYDGGDALVAEYTQNAPASTTPPQTIYLTADTLGSPRINTNQKGEVVARHDYLPFGDEIVGLGQRIQHQEYVDDDVRQKFTGYEKDEESGLDFAQARYYGNGLGRFTSVDPAFDSAKIGIPQSWNRYSYVLNNPLNLVDPDGERWFYQKIYENGKWVGTEAQWVNPNQDGSYTSPGEGWIEFIPGTEPGHQYLPISASGCTSCYYLIGENRDGSPIKKLFTNVGGVQNQDAEIFKAIVIGKATGAVMTYLWRGATALWSSYIASRAAQTAETATADTVVTTAETVATTTAGTTTNVATSIARPVTGDIFERTIQTPKGPVDVLAEIVVEGDKLILKDIAIFGRQAQPLTGLTKEILRARSRLIQEAKALGFKELQIIGQRVMTSTSRNPGHPVNVTIKIN
jgi:RHS repeat-associated protein